MAGTTGQNQRLVRRFRRTILCAAACTALVLGSLTLGGASAEPAPPFSNGRASAVAQILGLAPGVGSLQLGVSSGRTVAQLANKLAQAQAQTLDLGLVGTSLTAEGCNGTPAAVKPEQLPQPITVDNRKGDASRSGDDYPIAGSPLGGGRRTVAATTTPSALATVETVASVLGPLATISGGRSSASTRVVDGAAREAEATTSVDLDIAGIVQLHGLQWRAFHRTGADPSVSGTFSVDSASVGGVPLPVDQLGMLQSLLNTLLAPSGISIAMPGSST